MKNYLLPFILIVLLAANSCCEKTDTVNNEEAVKKWMKQYVANKNAGDFDNYGSFWTDDAVWMPPDAPIVIGKAAILDYVRPFFARYNFEEKLSVKEIKVIDDFAYIRIFYNIKYTQTADNTEPMIINDNKGIFLLRKKSDGSWVATHCIWNYNSRTF